MEPKRSKYDTNPLEEEVARRADESFAAARPAASTEDISGSTTPINRSAADTTRANESEAPTRRIDQVTSYPSVFVPPQPRPQSYEAPRVAPSNIYQPPPGPPPMVYQSPGLVAFEKSGCRNVVGLGIQERWAAILPYFPFSSWLGMIAAVIELLLTPRSETRIRFHASQALILQAAITALTTFLIGVAGITGKFTGATPFRIAAFVFMCVAVVKVWKGKPFVISALEEPRKWLDEKISARK
jgi:uncharacterized membrane protein